nr:MAG TPA: hypothetical protein [Caudoviricetes sp.]
MKKIQTLRITAKRWYQRSYGNTYHVVKVIVNGDTVLKSGVTYGYENHYLTTTANLLRNNGYDIPGNNAEAYSLMTRFPHTVEDVKKKKDLVF